MSDPGWDIETDAKESCRRGDFLTADPETFRLRPARPNEADICGVAARDIQAGETVRFSVLRNTADVLVKLGL